MKSVIKKVMGATISLLVVASLLIGPSATFAASEPSLLDSVKESGATLLDTAKDKGTELLKATVAKFKDITNHWARATIEEMAATGIINGYSDGTFKPNDPVKTDEFLKMFVMSMTEKRDDPDRPIFWTDSVWNRLNYATKTNYWSKYKDWKFDAAKSGYWAKPYIDVSESVFFPFGSGIYNYQSILKREDVARLMYLALQQVEFWDDEDYAIRATYGIKDMSKLNAEQKKAVADIMAKGIMNGYDTGYFGVGKPVTRAEALTIIQRFNDATKRKPVKVNLDGIPYVTTPLYNGFSRIEIVHTDKIKDMYTKTLDLISKYDSSTSFQSGSTFYLFQDTSHKDEFLDPSRNPFELAYEGTINFDSDHRAFYVSLMVGEDAKSFERHKSLVQEYLVYMLGSKDGVAVLTELSNIYSKMATKPYAVNSSRDIGNYLVTYGTNTNLKSVGVTLSEKH